MQNAEMRALRFRGASVATQPAIEVRRMPEVSNTADLARFQAAAMLCGLCPPGPELQSDYELCV